MISLSPRMKFMREPVFDLSVDGKRSLARMQVVERVLGDFARRVMDIRHDFVVGNSDGIDAIARIEKVAEDCGKIFLGENEAFEAASWNTLGRMRGLFRALAEPAEVMKRRDAPATAFFVSAAKIVIAGCEQIETRERPDAEVNADLQRYFESVAARLIGFGELRA
jgi:hypothetical protein